MNKRFATRSYRQVCLVIILLAASILYFSYIPQTGFVTPHFVNSGHALVFGLGAFLLMQLFARPEVYYQVLFCALLAFVLGVLVEFLQPFIGRQRSGTDVLYDFLGSAAAALWFISRSNTLAKWWHYSFRLFALLLILGSLAYPTYRLYIQYKVDEQVPTLVDFDAFWWSNIMWANNKSNLHRVKAPSGWENDTYVGRINFPSASRYPGVSFAYIYPDWSQYDFLEFELYSEASEDLSLTLRVHDVDHDNKYSDRFNHDLVVRPGFNKYAMPIKTIRSTPRGRDMDMKRIQGLAIFMVRPKQACHLYLDNLRLTRRDTTANEYK